jgi:glycosyltransferase involved in cell wall biosynthesis
MRVVLLGNYSAWPFHQQLGIDPHSIKRVTSWNETLASALAKEPDTEVYFFTICKGSQTQVVKKGRLTVMYYAVSRWANAATGFAWTAMAARRFLREIQPDLIHGIGTEHIWATVAVGSKSPHVITIHGILNKFNECTQPGMFSRDRYFAYWERRAIQEARQIICISPYVREMLAEFGARSRTYSVENPVNDRFYSTVSQPEKSRRIVFVGDTGKRKGLITLIQALGKLKSAGRFSNWHLDIVGPSVPGAYHESVMASIQQFGLQSQVTFSGVRLPDAMAEMYAGSSIFVLPSGQETAPMSIGEAMACGLPVIATRIAGVPHMVAHEKSGYLVEVNDADGLAESLSRLIDDPGLRHKMGREGANIAAARWRPEEIAHQTVCVYQDILGSNRRGQVSAKRANLKVAVL